METNEDDGAVRLSRRLPPRRGGLNEGAGVVAPGSGLTRRQEEMRCARHQGAKGAHTRTTNDSALSSSAGVPGIRVARTRAELPQPRGLALAG